MSKYGGYNQSNSLKFLFQERIKWFNAFRDPENEYKLKSSTFLEMNLYEHVFFHRVNQQYETIVPKPEEITMRQINNSPTITSGIPIALESIQTFSNNLRDHFQSITYDVNPDFLSPKIYRSYLSPESFYVSYTNGLFQNFYNYIQTNNYNSNITHFGDFVKLFFLFLNQKGKNFPFTMTAWQKSGRSNIFSSGLAFSISNLDCGDDRNKEKFIQSGGFDAYITAAGDHGFHVLAGCPWVLVYSLKSSNAIEYLTEEEEYSFTNQSSIYNHFYNKTYINDIEYIIKTLISKYNNYITQYPYYKKTYWNGCKTCIENIFRTSVTLQEITSNYDDLYWLKFYNKLRNVEEGKIYTDADVDRIEQNLIYFQKKLDNQTALGYINDQYRFFYVYSDYGINEYLRNLESEE